MKKAIISFIIFALSCSIFGQIQNAYISKLTEDLKYKKFLELFIETKLPFNYKKELNRVFNESVTLKDIPEKEAMLYLDMQESELYKTRILYNYDTDTKTIEKEIDLPVAHLKILENNYNAIIYRINTGHEDDTTLVYLKTMDYNGRSINKIIVGERFTREDDWMSFICSDQKNIKVFKYEVNWNNFKKEGQSYQIIDKEGSRTTVIITDYQIDENGKINKTQEYVQILKNDINDYKKYNPNTDDIMNQYY
jgi:hypothetical protein